MAGSLHRSSTKSPASSCRRLGWWVLAEACRQMAMWRSRHPFIAPLRDAASQHLAGSSSPVAPTSRPASRNVPRSLSSCRTGKLLCLEITKNTPSSAMSTKLIKILHGLKALGITLAIDDFGTGYSSMSRLKGLPVDALEDPIETFVAGLGTNAGDQAIVDATGSSPCAIVRPQSHRRGCRNDGTA